VVAKIPKKFIMRTLTTVLAVLTVNVMEVLSECYFPVEMQGEFTTQWKNAHEITYTGLSLTYNSVPGWGTCHSKHRENIILRDNEMTGGDCFRCIRIVQRSPNVNQVHARNLNTCFATEQEALEDCPQLHEVRDRKVEEIMLYKTRGFYGEPAVSQVHCPFSGKWKFSYASNNGKMHSCSSEASEAGGCPGEFMIDLKFRDCDFPDFDMSFQCLGHWTGDDGLNYLSLLDMNLPQLGEEPRPRYRCAVYQSDPHSGITHMALSNDSTCVNQLENHQNGYETLKLENKQTPNTILEAKEKYPIWAQGDWGKISIHGADLSYRSAEELTTYHARALISPSIGKFLARIGTACGELGYACVALELRADNILEIKIGKVDSTIDLGLCSEDVMAKYPWVTVGKEAVKTDCPLTGIFTGIVPDAEGLCARSSTSCSRPDLMEYQVYNCENTTEVYEDRLYQCYGQFRDDDGLVYTYTRRLDIPIQECFVGITVGPAHYIMEAGAHCQRGKQPAEHGMVMIKEQDLECGEDAEDTAPPTESSTIMRAVSPRLSLDPRPENMDQHHHGHHGHGNSHDGQAHQHHHVHVVGHHSRPETSSRRSSSSSSDADQYSGGQTQLTPSLYVILVIIPFLLFT
jgi:hypothetical protein